jgi:hypothetical protein
MMEEQGAAGDMTFRDLDRGATRAGLSIMGMKMQRLGWVRIGAGRLAR